MEERTNHFNSIYNKGAERMSNTIECECCESVYGDGFMWWSGRFWYCFECASIDYETGEGI